MWRRWFGASRTSPGLGPGDVAVKKRGTQPNPRASRCFGRGLDEDVSNEGGAPRPDDDKQRRSPKTKAKRKGRIEPLFSPGAEEPPRRPPPAREKANKRERGAGSTPRVRESVVRDRLLATLPGGRKEVACSGGFVDIVTDTEIIEVKRGCNWKAALGQVMVYGEDFPGRRKRVHLFEDSMQNFLLAFATCERFNVVVTSDNCEYDAKAGRVLQKSQSTPGQQQPAAAALPVLLPGPQLPRFLQPQARDL